MIPNNRLQTAALAALLLGVAFAGVAVAQVIPGPVCTQSPALCAAEQPAEDAAAAAQAALDACSQLDPPDNVQCIVDFASGQAPGADPNDLCVAADLDGDFPDCILDLVPPVDPDATACTVIGNVADTDGTSADECAGDAAQSVQDLLAGTADTVLAALAAVTAPAINDTSLAASDTTPAVGQTVSFSGEFSTLLSRLPGPLADLSNDDNVGALDDVVATVTPAGANVLVDNVAHTFTATFTPAAAGTTAVTVTLSYDDPLGLLAGTPLDALVSDSATQAFVAFVPNQRPLAAIAAPGTVMELSHVVLSGAGSSDPDNGPSPLTYAWSQSGSDTVAVTLSGATSSVAGFTAPDVDAPADLHFSLVVRDGDLGSIPATKTVHVSPSSNLGTVSAADTTTDLSLDNGAFVGPVAGVASGTSITAILHDLNGVNTLDNDALASTLTGPQSLSSAQDFASAADSNPEGDFDTQRVFLYDLSFPDHLQDGAYQFASTYAGSAPVSFPFTVDNVAPTLSGDTTVEQTFLAGHGAFVTDPVTVTLDDDNWGGFGGASVTELKALTLSGVPSGLDFQVSEDDGATWSDVGSLAYDLSTAASDGSAPLQVLVRLASPDGLVPDGPAAVTAVLTDDNDAASDPIDAFTLLIRPVNYGFFFGVDDGGDGISIGSGSITPGTRNDSSGDPVAVAFTGTFDADALVVSIGQFQCVSLGCDDSFSAYNSNPAKNGKVLLYATPDLTDLPLEAVVDSTGAAGFDLTGLPIGVAGATLYAVLDIYVPAGLHAGTYVGTVNVDATGDAP
jgi:hypothetical protein